MTPHGQRQVDAAKADGRWDAAYAPQRAMNASTIPADLRAAIDASPRARKTFATLNKQNLFSLVFRTNAMKTPEGRAKKSRPSSRCWRAERPFIRMPHPGRELQAATRCHGRVGNLIEDWSQTAERLVAYLERRTPWDS